MNQQPTIQLQDNQVVQTTTTDVATYIKQKQQQIEYVAQQITSLQAQMQKLVNDLTPLVPPTN